MYSVKRCLFCKKSTENSKSKEHIIPESIGSKKKVLPQGIVCDQCNKYFAIKVENPVLSHISMRNMRAYHQVPNKKGSHPSLLGELAGTNIKVSLKLKNGVIDLQPEKEEDRDLVNELYCDRLKDNSYWPVIFPINIDPPQKEMSRFLAKMALESLAYRFINETKWIDRLVDDPYYDSIRNYARYGPTPADWPFHQRRIYPIETFMTHPETGEWVQAGFGFDLLLTSFPETYFVFIFYGMEYVINIGGPSIKGYENWLLDNNNISPVIERLEIKLVTKVVNKKACYFLEGDFDISKGILFDRQRYKIG